MQGRLYITGGCSGHKDSMEVYCPDTNIWTVVDTKLVFSGRIGSAFITNKYLTTFIDT